MLSRPQKSTYWWLIALAVVPAALMLFNAGHLAMAQDISDGVTTATTQFKSILKTVFGVASIVIVVGGLVLCAFKFTQRDPHALHYLVGTIAAALICGVVAGIL